MNPAATVTAANSDYQTIEFRGGYSPITLTANDKNNLYLGSGSTLFWPSAAVAIGACRAYFHVDLNGSVNTVRVFSLGFGDEETSITTTDYTNVTDRAGAWYSLNGRKLDGQPTKRGLYIHGGRKVVVP